MLVELTIRNFAIIDEIRLTFQPGFNVLTGETGAGKSIIIDAVTLLLGGRGITDFVRAGTDSAYIEGIFRLTPRLMAEINPKLSTEGLEGDNPDTLILSREIRAAGRNFCRINGRSASLSLLAELAEPLIDIHGQHHHLSLLKAKAHQALLDRFGGLEPDRQAVTTAYKAWQKTRRELRDLHKNEQQSARRMDQLTFQVEEIEAAALEVGEDVELTQERTRLANAEKLSHLSSEAYQYLIEGPDNQPAATDLLGEVVRTLSQLEQIDETTSEFLELAENIAYEIEDLSGRLQSYADEVEFNPRRLEEVEGRLGLIYLLKRKYGDSIEEILAFGERAQNELDSITNAEARIEWLNKEDLRQRRELGQLAATLSEKRHKAAKKLAVGVEKELKSLGMEQTQFSVDLRREPDPDGALITEKSKEKSKDKGKKKSGEVGLLCDETGFDQIEFLIAPNPGEPLKPMIKIASGGETSRLMLALKTVLAAVDDTPTLIFDEIDQGIGGRVGAVVGRKLWGLSEQGQHQILCITHLPQIAAFGDVHYHVAKEIKAKRTTTRLTQLIADPRITELAQMLGTLSDNTRSSAQELLEQAETMKVKQTA